MKPKKRRKASNMTGNNRNTSSGQKGHAKRQRRKKNQNSTQNNNNANNKKSQNIKTNKTSNGLMSSNANYRPMQNGFTKISVSDFLFTVDVAGSGAGTIRKSFPISPSTYPGTRLTQLSDLWERYKFTKFNVRYVPSVPHTIATQICIYSDTDPNDDPTTLSGDQLIRQAVSQAGSQQWNFNNSKVISLARRGDDQLYYTGQTLLNERFNYQGTAYLVQVTNPMDFNGGVISSLITCGSVYIDWEIMFQTPQINPVAVARYGSDFGSSIRIQTRLSYEFNADNQSETFTVPPGKVATIGVPLATLRTSGGQDFVDDKFILEVTDASNSPLEPAIQIVQQGRSTDTDDRVDVNTSTSILQPGTYTLRSNLTFINGTLVALKVITVITILTTF